MSRKRVRRIDSLQPEALAAMAMWPLAAMAVWPLAAMTMSAAARPPYPSPSPVGDALFSGCVPPPVAFAVYEAAGDRRRRAASGRLMGATNSECCHAWLG